VQELQIRSQAYYRPKSHRTSYIHFPIRIAIRTTVPSEENENCYSSELTNYKINMRLPEYLPNKQNNVVATKKEYYARCSLSYSTPIQSRQHGPRTCLDPARATS